MIKNILPLASFELKKHGKSKAFSLNMLFFTLIFIGAIILGLREFLKDFPNSSPQIDLGQLSISMTLIYLAFIPFELPTFASSYMINPLIRDEKISKRLLFLLSSPLKVHEIWLGKTLALYLMGLIWGIIGATVYYLGIQIFTDLKLDLGLNIIAWASFNATVMPLSVVSLATLLCLLMKRPEIVVSLVMLMVILPFVGLGFLPPELLQNLAYLQKLNYLIGTIIGIMTIIAVRFLDKERIVRSCL